MTPRTYLSTSRFSMGRSQRWGREGPSGNAGWRGQWGGEKAGSCEREEDRRPKFGLPLALQCFSGMSISTPVFLPAMLPMVPFQLIWVCWLLVWIMWGFPYFYFCYLFIWGERYHFPWILPFWLYPQVFYPFTLNTSVCATYFLRITAFA